MTENEKFEVIASAFHSMTGMLAPGKDSRDGAYSYEDRREEYNRWIDENGRIINAMIKAMEDVL